MLPEREIDLLTTDVVDAVELAVVGRLGEGHERLHAGLARAEAALSEGRPWAEALIRRYHDALQSYAARYQYPAASDTAGLLPELSLRLHKLTPDLARRPPSGRPTSARPGGGEGARAQAAG